MSTVKKFPLSMLADVVGIYGAVPRVSCKGLCQAYCCPIGDTLTEFERARIVAVAGHEPNGLDASNLNARCNMLDKPTGRCKVYGVRPMICRVWGAADDLPCPHGCKPDEPFTGAAAARLFRELGRVTSGFKKCST